MNGEGPKSTMRGQIANAALDRSKQGIRCAVALLAAMALFVASEAEPPAKLPSVALGQKLIYRLEVGLVPFYGGLVILTPLFYGVIRGSLPIEVSARGARFPEDVAEGIDQSLAEAGSVAADLEARLTAQELQVTRASLHIDQLARKVGVKLVD